MDARLPIRFGPLDSRQPGEAVLTDGDLAPPPSAAFIPGPPTHRPDCACCTPRSAAAAALANLFVLRATTPGPAFRGVLAVVTPDNAPAVRAAIQTDPLASARFRLSP